MTSADWLALIGIGSILLFLALLSQPERAGRPRIKRAQHLHMRAHKGRLVECRVTETEEEDL